MINEEDRKRIHIIAEQLQAKIRGLQTVSTFLAGFAFTVFALQIEMLWQSDDDDVPFFIVISIPLMVGAVVLYIYAVIKLAGLAMPKPFRVEDERDGNLTDEGFHE